MANLLVRGIDDELVQQLREQAAAHGRSAEAEHRAILAAALSGTKKRTFAQFLTTMPNVGLDEDFARESEHRGPADVFD
jgi:plasmid stability protein